LDRGGALFQFWPPQPHTFWIALRNDGHFRLELNPVFAAGFAESLRLVKSEDDQADERRIFQADRLPICNSTDEFAKLFRGASPLGNFNKILGDDLVAVQNLIPMVLEPFSVPGYLFDYLHVIM
jgi:hypothetical protein